MPRPEHLPESLSADAVVRALGEQALTIIVLRQQVADLVAQLAELDGTDSD